MRIISAIFTASLLLGCSDTETSSNDEVRDATDSGPRAMEDLHECQECDMAATSDLGMMDSGNPGSPTADVGVTNDVGADLNIRDSGPDLVATCTQEPNAGSPTTDTCLHGSADWLAWEWIPDEDMRVTELQMHTDEGFAALFADDATKPGVLLVEGALSAADADGWRRLVVDPPITITAGSTYWIGEDVTTCSTVEDGTEFTYFTSDSSAGPWSGPYTAHPFTARIGGSCP